jgi:two-component system, OmpR family, sensor kinase
MSLTSRLSAFFLVTLAVVLVGFSAILFILARAYIYLQIDDRLQTAMATLNAAAEVNENGVEWEGKNRHLSIGQSSEWDQVRWLVQDEKGLTVQRSPNLEDGLFKGWVISQSSHSPNEAFYSRFQGQDWRVLQLRVNSETRESPQENNHRNDDGNNREVNQPNHSSALIITAGFSLAPAEATLQTLALTSGGVSFGLWVLAVLLGRWLSRQALVPLARMAQAVQTIDATALDQRLPDPKTGDELQKLSTAFNAMLTRLQEAFARQARFTGDASHQLRTPLTALLGQIEVALRRDRGLEEYKRTLLSVQHQGLNLRQIVEMLLFLARADAESNLSELEEVDLAEWLSQHLNSWTDHNRFRDIKLKNASGRPIPVRVQPPLLGQLVDNLLENACKYSQSGSQIDVTVGADPKVITLTIQDSGCGVAADDIPHIFEPFYRSPQARRSGLNDVGLGLSVVQRIAKVFGGRITVVSELGKGACFTVHLPLVS